MNKYKPESAVINRNDLKRKKIVFSENKRNYECISLKFEFSKSTAI